jgi:Domain of unknown function (DUF1839)
MATLLGAPETTAYVRHALHDEERVWPETNCYVDLWIEVLHDLGLEPMAGMAFTLGLDFEGDQYTFFKYSHDELRALYGVEVQEINLWKSLLTHAVEQSTLGRVLMPEVDSFFLPDTAGVSYQVEHTKTTIGIASVDVERRELRYYHGRGLYTLSGSDFAGVFRLDEHEPLIGALPPFAEIAKLDRLTKLGKRELVDRAIALARKHLALAPTHNPIARHLEQLDRDLAWVRTQSLGTFHQYAFATVRQAGACYALTAAFLRWLEANGERGLEPAAAAFDSISTTAKTVQFKLARMVNLKREIDVTPLFQQMARSWDEGMLRLRDRLGD